jgi:hypothetical protein
MLRCAAVGEGGGAEGSRLDAGAEAQAGSAGLQVARSGDAGVVARASEGTAGEPAAAAGVAAAGSGPALGLETAAADLTRQREGQAAASSCAAEGNGVGIELDIEDWWGADE